MAVVSLAAVVHFSKPAGAGTQVPAPNSGLLSSRLSGATLSWPWATFAKRGRPSTAAVSKKARSGEEECGGLASRKSAADPMSIAAKNKIIPTISEYPGVFYAAETGTEKSSAKSGSFSLPC